MAEPVLNELDRQSPTWLKLRAHLDLRLAEYRRRNDAEQPELKTARLRGRIAEVLELIALGEQPEHVEAEDSRFEF